MKLTSYKDHIGEEDFVVIWQGRNSQFIIKICAGETHQTKYGVIKHSELVGRQYGTKFACGTKNLSKGWVYLLHPNLELWTKLLPHRTQILYPTDISIILLEMDISPGKIICESGTGSGCLSHYIMNAILPDGHLFTFDIDVGRSEYARKEFVEHGFKENIEFTITNRNVCEEGFKIKNEGLMINPSIMNKIENEDFYLPQVDVVILDLPTPWLAIPHTKHVLNSNGGRIVSFSPCIEQVQRSVECLKTHNFTQIKTLECMNIPYNFKDITLPSILPKNIDQTKDLEELDFAVLSRPSQFTSHTGFLTFATLIN